MKKSIKQFLAIASLLMLGTIAVAQEEPTATTPTAPRWVSEKGYWVVESNVNSPKQCTIRFYNNEHVLVYSEKVEGVVLKLEKTKVKMHLKKVLESSVIAWEAKRKASENEGWVINAGHKQ
jgi:hypothetical protein